jgi:hypothetical protein
MPTLMVGLLYCSRGFEPIGENCQWQFAREQTLENLFFKDVVSGSRNVTKSRSAHQLKIALFGLFLIGK